MKINYLQHVPFETPANIEQWAREKGHLLIQTKLFANNDFAPLADFDWLVIMGGPMNIYEEKKYPWLVQEKKFIEKAVNSGKFVLGICLGAQLIADVLGAKIYRNKETEIGWHQVNLTPAANNSPIFNSLPQTFNAFHWHGDTFDIPSGATRIAESAACPNQAFEYKQKTIGLQFHLESSAESINELIEHGRDELIPGRYIQSPETMLAETANMVKLKDFLYTFLARLEQLSVNE